MWKQLNMLCYIIPVFLSSENKIFIFHKDRKMANKSKDNEHKQKDIFLLKLLPYHPPFVASPFLSFLHWSTTSTLRIPLKQDAHENQIKMEQKKKMVVIIHTSGLNSFRSLTFLSLKELKIASTYWFAPTIPIWRWLEVINHSMLDPGMSWLSH